MVELELAVSLHRGSRLNGDAPHPSAVAALRLAKSAHAPPLRVRVESDAVTVAHLAELVTSLFHDEYPQLTLRPSLLVNPSRNAVAPLGSLVSVHFHNGDQVIVAGDIYETTGESQPERALSRPNGGNGRESTRIPCTILTGFLGAGKTTVLNHLLHKQKDKKIAVIENEFGEISLDDEFLKSAMSSAEQVVVLDNGCMCCTVRGDLLGAFTAILAKMDSRRPLDAVLLETTGMADPLPIVRTILQTPTISSSFKLDGVVTLVDAKNIGPRLARAAAEGGDLKAGQVDEAFMQVCFADRIILNKVDLVAAADALEAWELVREINPDAPVLACSRGELHPSEITGFGAFDMSKMIASDPDFASREENAFSREDESHSHAHAHAHGEHCSTECGGGHEDAHSHHDHADGHGDACDERCAEDHESRHSAAVGSFSIVREGFEVDMLLFAQWMRQLATLDPELGLLYRSKALLAAAGSNDKVAFHAVSDVMEKGPTLKWGKGEPRGCKIVFIGKNLRRPWFEEGFDACLLPVKVAAASVDLSLTLKSLKPHLLGHILVYLLSVEVASVSMACQGLWGAVSGDASNELYVQQDCITLQASKPGLSYLHPHLALRSLASYLQAVKKSRVKLPKEGITFQSPTQVEAAGVTWLELAGVDDPVTKSFVVEFRWRPETLADFFATPGASVSSSMVRVEYEYTDEDIDEEVEDTLKFRLVIKPYKEDLPEPDAFELEQYRLYIQTVGGRSCSQVYLLSFGSIHPHFQTHIQVPDHRMPYFETDQTFHKYHPLFAAMRADGFLRFLIRVKPDGSGPLDTLCGCC